MQLVRQTKPFEYLCIPYIAEVVYSIHEDIISTDRGDLTEVTAVPESILFTIDEVEKYQHFFLYVPFEPKTQIDKHIKDLFENSDTFEFDSKSNFTFVCSIEQDEITTP